MAYSIMINETTLVQHYAAVRQRIQAALEQNGRLEHVQLLAVSKRQSAEAIRYLATHTPQREFGENYGQEALEKMSQLGDLDLIWHFIGHVQRNKTRILAEHFDWVHGVDRLMIAQRLSEQRPPHLPPLNVCIQVNIDNEPTKDGCQPNELAELVTHISPLPGVCLRGLMVIPAPENTAAFSQTADLFQEMRALHQQPSHWDTLSMGMSNDLEAAVAAGATLVRVGTALFGERL